MTDLKDIDGQPGDVAVEAITRLEQAFAEYGSALHETSKWVRNATQTEALAIDPDINPEDAWRETWEGRLMTYLINDAGKKSAAISKLKEIVAAYEGYTE